MTVRGLGSDDLAGSGDPRRDWVTDHLRLAPAGVWPFVAIAAFLVALQVRDAWAAGSWAGLDLLTLAILVFDALLPAAVLVGCRGDWRSAPVVFAGAVVWTWLVVVVGMLMSLQTWLAPETWPDQPLGSGLRTIHDLAAVIALGGPVVIAYGLSRRRRSQTTWPRVLVAAGIVGAVALGIYAAQNTVGFYGSFEAAVTGSTQLSLDDQVNVILQAASPVELLGLGILAWSSLSALRAGETPSRFWGLVCASSTALFFLGVYSAVVPPAASFRRGSGGHRHRPGHDPLRPAHLGLPGRVRGASGRLRARPAAGPARPRRRDRRGVGPAEIAGDDPARPGLRLCPKRDGAAGLLCPKRDGAAGLLCPVSICDRSGLQWPA